MRNKRAEKITKKLALLLKEERQAQGLSHQALADKAQVHRSTISLIETGKRVPTVLLTVKLAMALNADLPKLLTEAYKE